MKNNRINKKNLGINHFGLNSKYQMGGGNMQPGQNSMSELGAYIQEQLQSGISPIELYASLLAQSLPDEEIQYAFQEIGYDGNDIEMLAQQAYGMLEQSSSNEQQPMRKAQFGFGSTAFPLNISEGNKSKDGYRPARNSYLPEDLANKGNVLGAASTAAEAYTNLFGKNDQNKDGLQDGSFRDLKKKRARHRDSRGEYYKYQVDVDRYDPNIDRETGENLNYVFRPKDLYQGRLDTKEQYKKRLDENSRINVDTKTGKYTGILSPDAIDPLLYNDDQLKTLNNSISLGDFESRMQSMPELRDLLSQQFGLSGTPLPPGTTYGVDPQGGVSAYMDIKDNPYLRETMLGENVYSTTPGLPTKPPGLFPQPSPVTTPPPASKLSFRQWYAQNATSLIGKSKADIDKMYNDYMGQKKYGGSKKSKYKKGGEKETLENWLDKIKDPIFKQAFLAVMTQNNPEMLQPQKDMRQAQFGEEIATFPSPSNPTLVNAPSTGPEYLPSRPTQLPTFNPLDEFVRPPNIYNQPEITRKNKFMGTFNYVMDSPEMEIYRDIGTAGVAGAGVINEMADARRYTKAKNDLRTNLTLADNIYGRYEEREGDRGMWDINTGLAQPDNLVVGYAQMGKEMSMEQPMPQQKEQIVDLDMETITQLIAAGADLEIV